MGHALGLGHNGSLGSCLYSSAVSGPDPAYPHSSGLDAVVVNPSGIIGPFDDSLSRMGAVLLALWRRQLPALVPGGFDWVDVRDVVHALRAAGARGRTGESYLVPGHRVSIAELAQLAAAVRGSPVMRRTAPSGLARAVAIPADVD